MYNYSVTPFNQNAPTNNSSKIGENTGRLFGNIAQGVADIGNVVKADNNKEKVDKFIQEYNSGTGVFAGIEGSLKTRKLARLLLPLDSALSKQYLDKADNEAKQEEKIKQNTEVMNARNTVATEEEDSDAINNNNSIDEEIKIIEAELNERQLRGYKYEGESKPLNELDAMSSTPNDNRLLYTPLKESNI